jgi:hypothetical protein
MKETYYVVPTEIYRYDTIGWRMLRKYPLVSKSMTDAAPDMYEALKDLLKLIDETGIYLNAKETHIAKAALSKANPQ